MTLVPRRGRSFQTEAQSSFRQLLDVPFLRDGQLIAFSTNRNADTAVIPHNLGRKPKGWLFLGITGAAAGATAQVTFYEKVDNPSDDKFLRLYQTSGPGADSVGLVWVF